MVRGGAEGEVTALLAHVDGVVQPSVARVAVRGVVGILVRGAHPSPLHVLRRCLVGVPCAAVDEVASASATLVLAGVGERGRLGRLPGRHRQAHDRGGVGARHRGRRPGDLLEGGVASDRGQPHATAAA